MRRGSMVPRCVARLRQSEAQSLDPEALSSELFGFCRLSPTPGSGYCLPPMMLGLTVVVIATALLRCSPDPCSPWPNDRLSMNQGGHYSEQQYCPTLTTAFVGCDDLVPPYSSLQKYFVFTQSLHSLSLLEQKQHSQWLPHRLLRRHSSSKHSLPPFSLPRPGDGFM